MIDTIKDLFQVKKLIALSLTFVFCYLAISGKITAEQFMTVFIAIVTFYFGQSTARQAAQEKSIIHTVKETKSEPIQTYATPTMEKPVQPTETDIVKEPEN